MRGFICWLVWAYRVSCLAAIVIKDRLHGIDLYTEKRRVCVTFVVCVQLAPNSDVSTAFWVTLKHDVTRVTMAAHEY